MKTILIVDDDDALRKSLVLVLRAKGYNILEAVDGMEALDIAAEQNPDCILSDVNMENMNGFMMLEMLREDPQTSLIPVVMMTGAAQDAGAWKADPNVRYLDKGQLPEGLFKILDSVCPV